MIKNKLNNKGKFILIFFLAMLVWWITINTRGLVDTAENFYFGATLGLLPLVGGLLGFSNSKKWGGLKSSMGRSVLFLSAGLIFWGIGTLIFAYLNIVEATYVPYPSIADYSYIISWPLWTIGMINLSKATGARFQLRKKTGKAALYIVPVLIALISYYLLIIVAQGGFDTSGLLFSELFFYLAYPLGDLVILTVALLVFGLSLNYLGGYFKIPILIILAGFVFNYFADFSFTYTTVNETFFVGNWVDLIFTLAMFSLSFGVSLMDPYRVSDGRMVAKNNEQK